MRITKDFMRVVFCGILFSLTIGIFMACNQRSEAARLLGEARLLAEKNPDSAMMLIDSINMPKIETPEELYMQYLVTRVQVRHKNFLDITADSIIFLATKYFETHNNDNKEKAISQFYSGCVRRQQKQFEQAMNYYKEAERYAQQTQDSSIKGMIVYNIGDILAEQGKHKLALERYRQASKYYQNEADKQAHSYTSIGRMFMLEEELDSAFLYFHKGLNIAEQQSNISLQSVLSQSLAVTYKEVENYEKAEKYLRQSLRLNSDSSSLPRYYLAFAKLYSKTFQIDSARLYIMRLKQNMNSLQNDYFQASALNFLANWEKMQGNNDLAFGYLDKRMKVLTRIMEDRENQSVYEIEKKYNYERIQSEYYRVKSAGQRWIILLLIILIVVGTLFVWYSIQQKNKKLEIQQNIYTLTEMNSDLEQTVQKKQSDVRKELLWRFDVAKKVLKLNEDFNRRGRDKVERGSLIEKFNRIVYGDVNMDEQWEVLLQTFKNARPGYAERIREIFPNLTEAEFRVCILTYADFGVKEIAVVLKQTANTIQTRRTTLRKKLGMIGGGDIAKHIDDVFG